MSATLSARTAAPDLVLDVLREHAASLLGTARRYSMCTDDAHDAYQRAVEIFLRRAHRLDRDGALPWLRTVVKHEALAVRAARQRLLGAGAVDLDAREAREAATPEERAAEAEALSRSAEALQRLKPQEVWALLLKAQGHSYREICGLTGWSYTKVNRCLTEGRRRFLERYAGIESGAECERWSDLLSVIADGEASADELLSVRPHLRNCPGCRRRLAEFRQVPRALGAVMPVAAIAFGGGHGGSTDAAPGALIRAYETLASGLSDRFAASAQRLHAGLEAASSGKLTAVAMSATAVGGGVAVVDGPSAGAGRPAKSQAAASARLRPHSTPARRVAAALADTSARPVAASPRVLDPVAGPSPARASRHAGARTESEFGFEAGGEDPRPAPAQTPRAPAGGEFGPASPTAEPARAASGASAGGEFGP